MKGPHEKDHHGDPERPPVTKEQALELLASLLVSTLDGQASVEDVQCALNGISADDDAWRVRVAECSHARLHGSSTEAGPSSSIAAAAAATATQEWLCPMCETVNWAPDARKSLRRRHDDGSAASLSSTQLRCACCGYGGVEEEGGAEGEGEP
ncbi:hypothetical protein ABL78_6172 [Leptomonas seymouri]|uniref:Uncharacterized protein n=1 Tax=Leptomonas seymouri TaxID=5684 RepID=A0A0N0P421_LEPSE|nr:hypothetical protein ABL78_6172 [Leptomonas seymouri]|eukprot:KPI84789.1 hypothetical protein ABL78_6172 [Leptomonas seymouri]